MNSKQYKEIIRPFLSDKRFRHSVYVAEECIALASRYGVDEKKAETVGILHDIMKELPKEEQLKMMEYSLMKSATFQSFGMQNADICI